MRLGILMILPDFELNNGPKYGRAIPTQDDQMQKKRRALRGRRWY
jgi:hypothetical protein